MLIALFILLGAVTTGWFQIHQLTQAVRATEQHIVGAILIGDQFELERIVGSLVTGHLSDAVAVVDVHEGRTLATAGQDRTVAALLQCGTSRFITLDGHVGYVLVHSPQGTTGERIGRLLLYATIPWLPMALTTMASVLIGLAFAWSVRRVFRQFVEQIVGAVRQFSNMFLQNSAAHPSTPFTEFDEVLQEMRRLRHHEQTVEQLNSRLHQQEIMVRLALHVAHDIRSPLSSIQIATRLLNEQLGSKRETADALTLLQLGSQRLATIANDLLKKRGPAAATADTAAPFSLHAVCDELVGELCAQPLGAGVHFVKQYHPSALAVTGERTGLQRAIGNIIKNALEAMQPMEAVVPHIFTIATTVEDAYVVLTLADTGPGMAPATLEKILAGGHTEGKADGHGIGMQVVSEAVQQCGGTLTATSQLGVGTTFVLRLPLVGTTAQSVMIPVVRDGIVLILDDDAGMRAQWQILLRAENIRTAVFASWEEYATIAEHVDLGPLTQQTVISDYHFANSAVDGVAILQRLHQRGIPQLVLCTAEYWKPALQEAVRALGATLCPKPVPPLVVQWTTDNRCAASAAAQPAQSFSKTEAAAGLRALVIDDDASVRFSWTLEHRRLGIVAVAAFASMEACEAAQPAYASYDLAFVDRTIEQSTWNVAQTIAHLKTAGVPKVYVVSGESLEVLAADPHCAGADGVLSEKVPSVLPGGA